jgi:hypothetical protein
MKKETQQIMKEWLDLYEKKNQDYGSSWEKTGKILSILLGEKVNIESVKDFNCLALMIRIIDKMSRISNIQFVQKDEKVKEEKLTETAADAGTYFFMMASLLSGGETKTTDFARVIVEDVKPQNCESSNDCVCSNYRKDKKK